MKSIHTDPQYEKLGFSGVGWMHFSHPPFTISINRGVANGGGILPPSVRAYHIHVDSDVIQVLDMYVHPGCTLYEAINHYSSGQSENVANHIFAQAMEHVKVIDFASHLLNESYKAGHNEGKREVQDDIKEALGL